MYQKYMYAEDQILCVCVGGVQPHKNSPLHVCSANIKSFATQNAIDLD